MLLKRVDTETLSGSAILPCIYQYIKCNTWHHDLSVKKRRKHMRKWIYYMLPTISSLPIRLLYLLIFVPVLTSLICLEITPRSIHDYQIGTTIAVMKLRQLNITPIGHRRRFSHLAEISWRLLEEWMTIQT